MGNNYLWLLFLVVPLCIGIIAFTYYGLKKNTDPNKYNNLTNDPRDPGKYYNSEDYNKTGEQVSVGGGRRKKRGNKKSTKMTMTTTGVYLLLGAILVGYITSKFV